MHICLRMLTHSFLRSLSISSVVWTFGVSWLGRDDEICFGSVCCCNSLDMLVFLILWDMSKMIFVDDILCSLMEEHFSCNFPKVVFEAVCCCNSRHTLVLFIIWDMWKLFLDDNIRGSLMEERFYYSYMYLMFLCSRRSSSYFIGWLLCIYIWLWVVDLESKDRWPIYENWLHLAKQSDIIVRLHSFSPPSSTCLYSDSW